MIKKPNIFTNATSELSQDAVLIWLVKWADKKYSNNNPDLHKTGVNFLKSLLKKGNQTFEKFENIEVLAQFKKIDILIKFQSKNQNVLILIEDKVFSSEHSNQLRKYKNQIAKNVKYDILVPIYLKTGFQHDLSEVENSGFFHYSINELFNAFEFGIKNGVKNDIFTDYYEYLKGLKAVYLNAENDYTNYKSLLIKDWKWWNWIGFFAENQQKFEAKWGIVPNSRENLVAFYFSGVGKKIVIKNKEYIFHPYIDVKYSDNRYFAVSYRLGLNGHHQKDKKIRDLVISDLLPNIEKEELSVEKPRFKAGKITIELLKITNISDKFIHTDLIKLMTKLSEIIKNNSKSTITI